MKKLFLINTNAGKQLWTLEENILRFLDEISFDGLTSLDEVEDDSSWEVIELEDEQLETLFNDVEILAEKDFE